MPPWSFKLETFRPPASTEALPSMFCVLPAATRGPRGYARFPQRPAPDNEALDDEGSGESTPDPPGVLEPRPGDVPETASDALDGGVVILPTALPETQKCLSAVCKYVNKFGTG